MQAILTGLLYPLRGVPLTFIVIYALAMTGGVYMGGIPAAATITIMTSWFLKYAFVLFDAVSLGLREPPVLSYEMLNPLNEQRPLGLLLVIVLFYSLCGLPRPLIGDDGVMVLRMIGLIALPASVATLGVTGSIVQALNPLTAFALMFRLGWYYLVVVAFAAAFGAGLYWVYSRDIDQLLAWASLVLFGVSYTWMAMFTILGCVLYERRTQIGLETWSSPEQTEAKETAATERSRDRVVDEFYQHWRIRSYANAWAAVERHIATAANAADDYLWIHERVTRWPDHQFADKIARELLPRLLEARRTGDALNVVRARLKANPDFRPALGPDLVRLAHLARDAGDRASARALLVDFERHFPGDRGQALVVQLRETLSR